MSVRGNRFAASPLGLLGQSGTPDNYIFDSDPETRNPIAKRERDLMWVVCCVALEAPWSVGDA